MPRNLIVLAVASLCLAACTNAPLASAGSIAVTANDRVERAADTYARVKPFADLLISVMPAPTAARLTALQQTVEHGLAVARVATSAAKQIAALKEAQAAIADLSTATGVPTEGEGG